MIGIPDTKKKNGSTVGLDIGTNSVKIVEIAETGEKSVLAGAGCKKLQGVSRDAVPALIKALAEEAHIISKDVNIAVSGPSVIVRFISMPKMRDEELRSAIRFEAEKFIPFNINDCLLDFQILRKNEKEGKLDMVLVAAKKEYIVAKVEMAQGAGFTVRVVDVDSFALANAFLRSHKGAAGTEKTVAILNIGWTATNLNIIRGETICLVRDIAVGGREIDAAIAKALGVDVGSVEALKTGGAEKADAIAAAIRPVMATLIDELRLSCSYYENQCGRVVEEFYLSGGSAIVAGVEAHLAEALGQKPSLLNPFSQLETATSGVNTDILTRAGGAFAVAVGLASR